LINGKNDNSGNLNMNYVNKRALEDISLNELVITSGMKSLYPAGLFIGRVSTIFSEEYDTSLELELEPVIDMSRIEYVFVMIEDSND
jgi:rod shape-determining protein MreC